jgi:hypothetical protein
MSIWVLMAALGQEATTTSDDLVWASAFLGFPIVGLIIAVRRPENPLGWCWLTGVFLVGLGVALQGLAVQWLFPPPGTPEAAWLAVIAQFALPVGFALIGLPATLLFPDGKLPSRRWRPLAGLGGAAAVVFTMSTLLRPTIVLPPGAIPNPAGIDGAEWLDSVVEVSGVVLFAAILVGAVSLIVRYHRSMGEVRLQLKWVAVALALALAGLLFVMFVDSVFGDRSRWLDFVPLLVMGFGYPTAVAVAILRYRLYSIDRIISRTVVYGAVVVALAAAYSGGATLLGSLVGKNSSMTVAGATLGAAALFSPVRRRVQQLVDRRFDRARYSAQLVVDAFSSRMQSEVNLNELTDDLARVVDRTLRPDRLSIWLAGDR